MKYWFRSFRHAFRGLRLVFHTERSFRIHIFVGALVLVAGVFLQLDIFRWMIILLTIGLVLSLEIVNSSVERLVDILAPKTHPFAKEAKDSMAAAVLVISIFALLIGLLVFVIK